MIRKKNILRIGKVNPYKHRVESLCELINTNEVISPNIPDNNTAEKEALRIISEKNLVKEQFNEGTISWENNLVGDKNSERTI